MKSMLIVWNCIVIIAVAIVLVISASTSFYIRNKAAGDHFKE